MTQCNYLAVRHPIALATSLMRFGSILRDSGDYDTALQYFKLLVDNAQLASAPESMAVGFHEMGLCYIGKLDILLGLEYFIKEKEIFNR